MRLLSRQIQARSLATRAVVVVALAIPTTAVAAPSTVEGPAGPPERDRGPVALAVISGFGIGLALDPEAAAGIHPVDGPVEYGDAEASFGNERGRPHEGQDLFAPAGTTLVSPVDTTVVEAGSDDGRGNWVALFDPTADRTFVYFHMLEPAPVGGGERLTAGDPVGAIGCTGSCYGDHLHFEIRDGRDPYGTPHDPLPELQRWERLAPG